MATPEEKIVNDATNEYWVLANKLSKMKSEGKTKSQSYVKAQKRFRELDAIVNKPKGKPVERETMGDRWLSGIRK
jgi:hypothetical protein